MSTHPDGMLRSVGLAAIESDHTMWQRLAQLDGLWSTVLSVLALSLAIG